MTDTTTIETADTTAYQYRAYCDICSVASEWHTDVSHARKWRTEHFEAHHPDNPMHKQNCRIQRHIDNNNE